MDKTYEANRGPIATPATTGIDSSFERTPTSTPVRHNERLHESEVPGHAGSIIESPAGKVDL